MQERGLYMLLTGDHDNEQISEKWIWLLAPVLVVVVGLGVIYAAEDGSVQVETVESIQWFADPLPTLRQAPDGGTFKHWRDGERDISLNEFNSQVPISDMLTLEVLGPTFTDYEQFALDEETTAVYYVQPFEEGDLPAAGTLHYIGWSKTTGVLNYRSFLLSCWGDYTKEELIQIVQSVTYKKGMMIPASLPDRIQPLSDH